MPKNDGKAHFLGCNADESKPGTFKDREIMRWTPRPPIEGCAIAAYSIGAERCYVYIRGEFTEDWKVMGRAVEEAYAKGVPARMPWGAVRGLISCHREAGAVHLRGRDRDVNSLEGKRGNPQIKPPFPAQAGASGFRPR